MNVANQMDPVEALTQLKWFPASLAVVCVIAGILNRGAMHQAAHGMIGLRRNLLPMTVLAGAAQSVNKVVKSGGMAGLAVFLRRAQGARTHVVAAYAGVSLANAIALATLMMLAIPASRRAGMGAPAMALGGLVLFGCLFAVVAVVTKWRKQSDGIQACPRLATRVLAHGLIDKAIGATALAFAAQASGASIGLSSVVVAYAAALSVSSAGPLPSGFGVVEATLLALFVTMGVPAPIAAATVFVFRLLDLWIPLAVGGLMMFFLPKKLDPIEAATDTGPLLALPEVTLPELLIGPELIPVPVETTTTL